MELLHYVSTKDHPISAEDLYIAQGSVTVMDNLVDQITAVDHGNNKAENQILYTFVTNGPFRLEYLQHYDDNAERVIREIRLESENAPNIFKIQLTECRTDFGSVSAEDPLFGLSQIVTLAKAAIQKIQVGTGAMPIEMRDALNGYAFQAPTNDDLANTSLPSIWLAASPLRPMRINAIEQDLDLHVPQIMCAKITYDRETTCLELSTLSGHTFVKRMNAVDGLRAISSLAEWREKNPQV